MLLHGSIVKLLHAERDALVGLVHFEHDGFDFVALLEDFGRMIDLAGPGNVGDVDHAVDALFQFDERAVAGEIANLAFDLRADRVFLHRRCPTDWFRAGGCRGKFSAPRG